jgi:hypothetical protein
MAAISWLPRGESTGTNVAAQGAFMKVCHHWDGPSAFCGATQPQLNVAARRCSHHFPFPEPASIFEALLNGGCLGDQAIATLFKRGVTQRGEWHLSGAVSENRGVRFVSANNFSDISVNWVGSNRLADGRRFKMFLLRQLLILAMVPLTMWSGMPHQACRCSNGEVHLFCPRLNQSQAAKDVAESAPPSCCASSKVEGQEFCCSGSQGTACCGSHTGDGSQKGAQCCAAGCKCTAIYVAPENSSIAKNVSVPDLTQFGLLAIPAPAIRLPRIAPVELSIRIDTGPRVPDDLIVLYERWLI